MNADYEYLQALQKAQALHPHVCPDMGRQIIMTIQSIRKENDDNHVSEPFGLTLRKALNARDIIANRAAYKTLVGYYFGRRANLVQKHRHRRHTLPERASVQFTTERNGQIAFVV